MPRKTNGPSHWVIIAVLSAALAGTARAEEPHCQGELPSVQREVTQTPLSAAKGTQIKALLDQVVRACKENNDIVAMAGIEQVRAIISTERNTGERNTGSGS
jgi:hypothetical protein